VLAPIKALALNSLPLGTLLITINAWRAKTGTQGFPLGFDSHGPKMRFIVALLVSLLSLSRAAANDQGEWLLKQTPSEQAALLARRVTASVGEECIGKDAFYQGTGYDGSSAYWSVRCTNGRKYQVKILADANGGTSVTDCETLLIKNGSRCFEKINTAGTTVSNPVPSSKPTYSSPKSLPQTPLTAAAVIMAYAVGSSLDQNVDYPSPERIESIDEDRLRFRGSNSEFVKIDDCRFRWISDAFPSTTAGSRRYVVQLDFSRLSNEYNFYPFGSGGTLVWSSLRRGALCGGLVLNPEQLGPDPKLETCAEYVRMRISFLDAEEQLRRLVRAFEFISSESCPLSNLPF